MSVNDVMELIVFIILGILLIMEVVLFLIIPKMG